MNIILRGQKQLEKRLNKINLAVRKGEVRAINKTATKAKTQATKAVGKQIILPASYIKKKLNIRKANNDNPKAIIKTESRGIQLRRFFVKQLVKKGKTVPEKPGGIAVKVKRRGRQKKIKNAFLIKLKGNNGYGIAYRKKGAKGRSNYRVLYGPSVSQVFNNIVDDIEPEILQALQRNMIADIKYFVDRV